MKTYLFRLHFFVLIIFVLSGFCFAQDEQPSKPEGYQVNGLAYQAMREIRLQERKPISVCTFYHHGILPADGVCKPNEVIVIAKTNRRPVASRVMQLGPGDFCRVAFESNTRDVDYILYYGLSKESQNAQPKAPFPEWTDNNGLILEIREYEQCNMNDVNSVKNAFDKAKRIGSDYVRGIEHGMNPFLLKQGPFLSRYTGTLNVTQGGNYGMFTASQDCSFLLIDGNMVASAPGRHGPTRQARPENQKIVNLTAGPHRIEYHHAAGGGQAYMMIAWELNPNKEKPKPGAVPPEAFAFDRIGREQAGNVSVSGERSLPDFTMEITGNVPLPDNQDQLVCVEFKNTTPRTFLNHAKCLWDFGDGQTSTETNPGQHIYLKPGLYTVTLTCSTAALTQKMSNRIYVDQPLLQPTEKPHTLDMYLPQLEKYDPKNLDPEAAVQLAEAYLFKIDQLLDGKAPAGELEKYRKRIVELAKAVLTNTAKAKGDASIHALAKLAGPIARDILADSRSAGQIWMAASQRITLDDLGAECAAMAADIMVNDLLDTKRAQPILEQAIKRIPRNAHGTAAANVYRIAGEIFASNGDREAALKAFAEAEERNRSRKSFGETTAMEGSLSRSAEGFIREKDFDRAILELRQWQLDYPSSAIDGYSSLLFAEYWIGKKKYDQAAALADRLLILNPDSSYIDQLLVKAAEAKQLAGEKDGALAYLHQLLKEYPGSELIEDIKKKITELEK